MCGLGRITALTLIRRHAWPSGRGNNVRHGLHNSGRRRYKLFPLTPTLSLQGEGEKQSRTLLNRPPLPSRKRGKNRAELSSIDPLIPPGRGRKTELNSARSAPSPSREREKNRAEFSSIDPLIPPGRGRKTEPYSAQSAPSPSREREKNRAEFSSIDPFIPPGRGRKTEPNSARSAPSPSRERAGVRGNIQPLTQPQKQKALHAGRAS